MDSQLTASSAALHLFFTDDIYLVNEPNMQKDKSVVATVENRLNVIQNPTVEATPVVPVLKPDTNVPVAEPIATTVATVPEFKFLGKNKRNILILVNDHQNEVSDESGRELLRKIVKSVNLSANDFALLNYAGYPGTTFKQLQDYFSCTLVFSFGVTTQQLSLPVYANHVIVSEGDLRMIFSAELQELDKTPADKKALWASLQNLGL